MARQHHAATGFNPTIPRPLAVRVISIIALLLLPILTVISFSFTLKTIYTPAFALSHPVADGGFDPDGNPLPAVLNFNLTYKRAPFYICGPDIGTYNNATAFNQTCTRIHGPGSKDMDECFVAFPRDEQLCQKVVASASLYVAAAVLIGLALPCAIAVAGLSFRSANAAAWSPGYSALPGTTTAAAAAAKHHHDNGDGDGEALNDSAPAETSTTTSTTTTATLASAAAGSPSSPQNLAASILEVVAILFLVLGAVCLIFAQVLGVQSLVNEQRPTASELDTALSRWFMGPAAYVYTSVAYLAAGLAAFAAASGCGVKGR